MTRCCRRDAVDAVLLLETYHEVADPIMLLEHLRPALKPGARLGIIVIATEMAATTGSRARSWSRKLRKPGTACYAL
jgi:hypothetical protein